MSIPAHVAGLRDTYARAGDGEHAAIAVLLAHPLASVDRFARHVDASGIDWIDVLAEGWSETERFLLTVAAGLWGRPTPCDMSRLAHLNDDQFELFQHMTSARMTGRTPDRARP